MLGDPLLTTSELQELRPAMPPWASMLIERGRRPEDARGIGGG